MYKNIQVLKKQTCCTWCKKSTKWFQIGGFSAIQHESIHIHGSRNLTCPNPSIQTTFNHKPRTLVYFYAGGLSAVLFLFEQAKELHNSCIGCVTGR